MKSLFIALALGIGLNAQAMFSPFLDQKLDTGNWKAIYAGETQLDGMDVAVVLEAATQQISIPSFRSRMPIDRQGVEQKAYRLKIVALQQPSLRVNYPLAASRDLSVRPGEKILVSADSESNIHFTVHGQAGGILNVEYTRKVADQLEQGSFEIAPMMQTM